MEMTTVHVLLWDFLSQDKCKQKTILGRSSRKQWQWENVTFESLYAPARVSCFHTDTASHWWGRVSCQSDWFPRKEVPVGYLLFNKCTLVVIQAFEQIMFYFYGKKNELFSLLHKNHHDLEFTTDSEKLVQNDPKVGCLACIVFLFFFFSKSFLDVRCCWTCLVASWNMDGHELPPGAATWSSCYYVWLAHKDTFILVGIN